MNESMENGETTNIPLSSSMINRPIAVRKVRLKLDKYLGEKSNKRCEPYYFTQKQIIFLETYVISLDFKEALKASGLTKGQVERSKYIQSEMIQIEEAFCLKHRVKNAMGTHLRLMEKFETDYDESGNSKTKTGLASTLARMSEANLKAAGVFKDESTNHNQQGVQVIINLDSPTKMESEGLNGQ